MSSLVEDEDVGGKAELELSIEVATLLVSSGKDIVKDEELELPETEVELPLEAAMVLLSVVSEGVDEGLELELSAEPVELKLVVVSKVLLVEDAEVRLSVTAFVFGVC